MTIHGWTAPEVGIAFERAEHLARELERSKDLAPPLAGLWLYHTQLGGSSPARMKLHKSCSRLQTLFMIPKFYSKHIIARGQFRINRAVQHRGRITLVGAIPRGGNQPATRRSNTRARTSAFRRPGLSQ
jgi:hypothetical protein